MKEFTFRHPNEEELPIILSIYSHARDFMRKTNNPTQWGDNWPPEYLIKEDIQLKRNYVCECNGKIVGVFAYMQGIDIDPTYRVIEDGEWLEDSEYGVIHRIASSGDNKGIGTACINFCASKCSHLRVDTHADNKVMQKLLIKNGFSKRGIIYVEKDNTPRIAFEKV